MIPIPSTVSVALLVGVAAGLGGLYAGIQIESNSRDAQRAVELAAMHDEYVAQVGRHRGIAQYISKELSNEVLARGRDRNTFQAALRRSSVALAVCPPIPLSTGAPRTLAVAPAESVLTAEFARLYDLAFGPQAGPVAGDPGSVDGTATQAGTVDPKTVLAVHGENADLCRADREKLSGWQALARAQGWVK